MRWFLHMHIRVKEIAQSQNNANVSYNLEIVQLWCTISGFCNTILRLHKFSDCAKHTHTYVHVSVYVYPTVGI